MAPARAHTVLCMHRGLAPHVAAAAAGRSHCELSTAHAHTPRPRTPPRLPPAPSQPPHRRLPAPPTPRCKVINNTWLEIVLEQLICFSETIQILPRSLCLALKGLELGVRVTPQL